MPNRFERALGARDTEGATEEFREFDPRESAEHTARAQFDALREQMGEQFESMRDRQAATGRLRTGFGFRDQDRFMRDRLDRLNRTLAQNAIELSGMRQNQLGSAAQMQGTRAGRRLRAESLQTRQERQDERDTAGILGGLGSLAGGGLGAILGGPAGATAGASIGGGAGRGIAGLF